MIFIVKDIVIKDSTFIGDAIMKKKKEFEWKASCETGKEWFFLLFSGPAWVLQEHCSTPKLHRSSNWKWACPGSPYNEEFACIVGDLGSIPGSGRSPWRRVWQHTRVFLTGEFHGQRSLASYSQWSCRVRHNWASNTMVHCGLTRKAS